MESWRTELYHYNHNHDALGRFSSSGGLGVVSKAKKLKARISEKQISKDLKKQEKLKARLEKRRDAIVSDPVLMNRYKKLFSVDELRKANTRFEEEKKLSEYSREKLQRGKKYFDIMLNYADTATRAYNKYADIRNAWNESKGNDKRVVTIANSNKQGGGDGEGKKKKNK